MSSSILLGVICILLSQFDFGEGRATETITRDVQVSFKHSWKIGRYSFKILKAGKTTTGLYRYVRDLEVSFIP